MSAPRKLIVIMEHGKVIGTQLANTTTADAHSGVSRQPAVTALLAAGPGQSRHEVMAHVPERFENALDIARFHESLLPLISHAN